jgi:homoserine dehydrogenase
MTDTPGHGTPGLGEIGRQVQGALEEFKELSNTVRAEFVTKEVAKLQAEKVDLQLIDLTSRVASLEDDKKWLIRLVVGFIVLGLLGLLFYLGQGHPLGKAG